MIFQVYIIFVSVLINCNIYIYIYNFTLFFSNRDMKNGRMSIDEKHEEDRLFQ